MLSACSYLKYYVLLRRTHRLTREHAIVGWSHARQGRAEALEQAVEVSQDRVERLVGCNIDTDLSFDVSLDRVK